LCAVPFVAWEVFVRAHTGAPDQTVLGTWVPFSAVVARTFHPVQFALTSRWLTIAATLDYVALLGVWAAIAVCVWLVWKRRFDLLGVGAVVFGVFAAFLGAPQIWADAYAFGRTLTPLLLLLALRSAAYNEHWAIVPATMVVPRILFQFQPQIKGILHQLL
jgi:hypothetical protein